MSSRDQDWRLDSLCPDRLPAALLLALGDSASEPNGIARVSGLASASRPNFFASCTLLMLGLSLHSLQLAEGPFGVLIVGRQPHLITPDHRKLQLVANYVRAAGQ